LDRDQKEIILLNYQNNYVEAQANW